VAREKTRRGVRNLCREEVKFQTRDEKQTQRNATSSERTCEKRGRAVSICSSENAVRYIQAEIPAEN